MTPESQGEEEKTAYIEVFMVCPFCGGLVPDDFECIKCGAKVLETQEEEETSFVCSNCSEMVDEDAERCPSCSAHFVG